MMFPLVIYKNIIVNGSKERLLIDPVRWVLALYPIVKYLPLHYLLHLDIRI